MATNVKQAQKSSSNLTKMLALFEKQREQRGSSRPMEDLWSSAAKSAQFHNKQYNRIIECYTDHAEKSLRVNLIYKRWYFYGSLAIMVGLFALVAYLALCPNADGSTEAYITAISAFVTAFIVLPVTITKYLFNPDESKNLNEIVQSIQKHDLAMTQHISTNEDNERVH